MGARALSSGGERFLDTEEVGGSNPPAPTNPLVRGDFATFHRMAAWGSTRPEAPASMASTGWFGYNLISKSPLLTNSIA
jgi:hypothetical protein